jgi:hypothetical protein
MIPQLRSVSDAQNYMFFALLNTLLPCVWCQTPGGNEKNPSTTRFSGRWYLDFQKSGIPPRQYSITDGEYVLTDRAGVLRAKFDGRDYPITNGGAYKNARVERVNSTTIREIDLDQDGKIIETDTLTLGSDGRTAVISERPHEKPDKPFYLRPAGGSESKSINGEWELIPEMYLQYDPIENGFKYSVNGADPVTVKFDGKHYPDKEPDWDSFQFIRMDDSSFYDIKYKGDAVTAIYRHSLSPDGSECGSSIWM